MKELKELKDKIKNIEITFNYEETYTELYNTIIDYMNNTQDFDFEGIFEDYVDEELMEQLVEYKIKNEGLWSVVNLVNNIDYYEGIYRIDAYGYGYSISKDDLECIKEEILDEIDRKLEEK